MKLKGLPVEERLKFYNEAMKIRREKGWGWRQIAERLSISPATVSSWLYQSKKPKPLKKRFGFENSFYGKHHTTETKEKISKASKGRRCSKDFCRRHSEHQRKRWQNSDYRKKRVADLKGEGNPFYGKHHTEETKRKISEHHRGKRYSPQTEFQNLWKIPKYRKLFIEAQKNRKDNILNIVKNTHKRPTVPERKLIEIIEKHKLPYRYTGNGSFWIENLNPDFVECNGHKIALEVFGSYWHSPMLNPKVDERMTFHRRKQVFKKYGWKCVIFWDDEVLSKRAEQIVLGRLESIGRR